LSVYDFSIFKNSSFGETISYTPSGSTARSIKAVVFRRGAEKLSIPSGIPTQQYPIVVEIDATDITSVKEKEDKINCADFNGVLKEYRVSKILYADAGCFKLGLAA
jgi:hypothetical protein